jgi:hypothetical protein
LQPRSWQAFPATHAPRADFQTAAREQFRVAEGFAAAIIQ